MEGECEMRVLMSTNGARRGVGPVVGLAVQLRTVGAQVRVWLPPDCAAAENCVVPIAAGVIPTGGRR